MANNIIPFPANRRNHESRPSLSGVQKEGVVMRWPIRHAAAANLFNVTQRVYPDVIRAISQPAVQAEVNTDNVVPIASNPRYEYSQETNEVKNRFEVDAARQAIANVFTIPTETQSDVEKAS